MRNITSSSITLYFRSVQEQFAWASPAKASTLA